MRWMCVRNPIPITVSGEGGGISSKKKGGARGFSVGRDGREEWCAAMGGSQGSIKRFEEKNYTRKAIGRPLADKLFHLSWVFPFVKASFIRLDSVSKAPLWLRCLVVCCRRPSIHLLQWPHNLTIYSSFLPIFSLNYLFPIFDYFAPPHARKNFLIHVRTLISSSITSHQWNSFLLLQEMGVQTTRKTPWQKFNWVFC